MNKKGFLYVLVLLLFTGCAKFGLDNFSFSSSQFVNINGVTGGSDASVDVYLFDGNIATINWTDESDEESYNVSLFENDGVTVTCAEVNVPQDTTSHTFFGCPLVEGRAYWALVEAVRTQAGGNPSPKTGSEKVKAQNVIGNGGFNFLYPPVLSLSDLTVNEAVGSASVVASLSVASDWPLSFDWSTSDGTAVNSGIFKDYDSASVTNVIIPAGAVSTNLSVVITDDPRDEFDQTLTISFSNEVAAKINAGVGARDASLTIQDNDPEPDLIFTNQTVTEGDSTTNITMSLSEISEKTISFSYSTVDGTATVADGDYVAIGATPVTFNPGDNDVVFSIASSEDVDVCEFDETVGIQISAGTNIGSAPSNVVSIEDDDLPTLSLAGDTQTEGNDLTFTATLNEPCPSRTVTFDWHTIDVSAKNGEDLPEQNGTVTFLPNDVSESFLVTTTDDSLRDLDQEYISIGARNRVNLDDSGAAATGVIIDNEVGELTAKVKTAGSTTCALSTAGQIKCWGMNAYIGYDGGHYGDQIGEMGDSLPRIDLGTGRTALKVVGASGASCALLDNSEVKCWGSSFYTGNNGINYGNDGNGLGDNLPYIDLGTHDGLGVTPHTAKDIVGTSLTFCALLDDDRLKCWGINYAGQTGTAPIGQLVRVGDANLEMGDNLSYVDFGTHDGLGVTPHTVKELSFPCAILDTDQVKCWGQNNFGQLGLGDTNHRGDNSGEMGDNLPYVDLGTGRTAQKISGSCAILDTSELKCWGLSSLNGSETGTHLGDGPGEMGDNLSPVDLGTYDHDSNVVTPEIAHTVKEVSAGYDHVCAILDDDKLKCWGENLYGKLGYGNQFRVGIDPNTMGNTLNYVNLGAGRTAKKVSVLRHSTLVLRDDDTLVSFGGNKYGTLGIESTDQIGDEPGEMGDSLSPVNLGTGRFATSLSHTFGAFGSESGSTRGESTCAVLDNGDLKCWGFMGFDAGIGDIVSRFIIGDQAGEMGASLQSIQLPTGTTAVDLFSGHIGSGYQANYCATLNNGNFICWGTNDVTPNFSNINDETGNRPNSMGDNLDQHTLPGGLSAIKIQPGRRSTCALATDHELYCWGGQFGYESSLIISGGPNPTFNPTGATRASLGNNRKILDFNRGNSHLCALLDNYEVKCWGFDFGGNLGSGGTGNLGSTVATSGDNLLPVDLGTVSYPVEVTTNYRSSCARFANGGIKCWGANFGGNLGYGDTTSRGGSSSDMGNNLAFIDLDGPVSKIYSTITTGGPNCAVRTNGEFVCWGGGAQLGIGSISSIGDGPNEMGSNLTPIDLNSGIVKDFDSKGPHVCIVQTNNELKCWGDNFFGQLGQGNRNTIGDDPNEMGVNLPSVDIVW